MGFDNDEISEHESFGLLYFGRVSGGSQTLFGSSIQHKETIKMTVSTAQLRRNLNMDWYHDKQQLIEIEMSQTQFAEAISSLNVGVGVPVTLRRVMGERMDNPPETNKRQLFEDEFSEDMQKVREKYNVLVKRAEEILNDKKPIKKKERDELLNRISNIGYFLDSTVPFVAQMFNEQMDKTVTEAKGEAEAFVQNKLTRLGLESLAQLQNKPNQIED